MVSRWILWLGQDYDITHDQPALQVIQANRQTDKTQITIPKLLDYIKTHSTHLNTAMTHAYTHTSQVPFSSSGPPSACTGDRRGPGPEAPSRDAMKFCNNAQTA